MLRWDLTLTTGLSAKNLVIYMLATFLALRMVIGRRSVMVAGPMHAAFLVQIAYAMCTWVIAAFVIDYQGYDFVATGIKLKSQLIDYYIFFLVFLFGIDSVADGIKLIKWMLFGAVFANLATVLDTTGLVNIGYQERLDGRAQGAVGESNQYATYIVLFLPGLVAAAVGARGFKRMFWLVGALLACIALAMTASRGGFVGIIIACAIGAYLYRRLISYSRAAAWVLGSLAVLVPLLSVSTYGGLLTERVFGQSASIDATEASSGRTEIWANLLLTMIQKPITFITGFGWDVYWTFPFRFSPHNHYLALWFNLGLVGLISGCYLLFASIGRARRASLKALPPVRGQLIAFVLGGIAVCSAVFFVDLHTPWYFFWMYAAVVIRVAIGVEASPALAPVPATRERAREPPRDRYGWTGAQERGRT